MAYMKTLIALVALLFIVAACSTQPAPQPVQQTPPPQGTGDGASGTPAPPPSTPPVQTPTPAPQPAPTPQPTPTPAGPPTKEFTIVASQFKFDPGQITVNKGDKVIIHVTSADVPHGFAIDGYDVNVAFAQGETKTVTFIADKAGTFVFFCSVPCGGGHQSMRGELVVNG